MKSSDLYRFCLSPEDDLKVCIHLSQTLLRYTGVLFPLDRASVGAFFGISTLFSLRSPSLIPHEVITNPPRRTGDIWSERLERDFSTI